MSVDAIAALLTQRTGLDPQLLGAESLAHAVGRRMAACGLCDPCTYQQQLAASDEEWHALVDEVVVGETWFFRDGTPFEFLGRYVRRRWQPAHPGGLLRVLCAPCSSGEEACSIAIALREAGLAGPSFSIEAIDLSRSAIARCRKAMYGKSSFRGEHQQWQQRYFHCLEGMYQPLPEITAGIQFRQGNLLEAACTAGRGPFDVIFCRNLLIYFTHPARQLVVDNLDRLLAEDGLLFAGHTEMSYTFGPRFVAVEEPGAFAYRKARAMALGSPSRPPARPAERPGPLPGLKRPPAAPAEGPGRLLEKARRLADQGALDDAAALCQQLLQQPGPPAGAWCLLGLIAEASGDRHQAESCYNRALFLDPKHYESLVHLTLLVELQGDAARAAALRQRLKGLKQREDSHAP